MHSALIRDVSNSFLAATYVETPSFNDDVLTWLADRPDDIKNSMLKFHEKLEASLAQASGGGFQWGFEGNFNFNAGMSGETDYCGFTRL